MLIIAILELFNKKIISHFSNLSRPHFCFLIPFSHLILSSTYCYKNPLNGIACDPSEAQTFENTRSQYTLTRYKKLYISKWW